MASFYEDASLVVIPSGYKTSKIYAEKPTDGSGDLTFTRASGATRVGPNGLIEKVRTNLCLQSQTFENASWQKYNATATANTTTAPDGTTTADTLTDNTANDIHVTYQSLSLTAGENTISVYAKANTLSHASIYIFDGANFFSSGIFNLSNGTVSGAGSIVSAGNGWYRISFTTTIASGSGNVYIALSNGSTISYAGTGQSIYVWGYQLETGVATDYIPTTTAAVSVGPVSNVPRLDYLGSSCPRLLLEPQRTNIAQRSEDFSDSYWSKFNTTITVNATTSPDGYVNADKFVENTANNFHSMDSTFASGTGVFTASIYAKQSERRYLRLNITEITPAVDHSALFDLQTGTVLNFTTGVTASIQSAANGFYRVIITSPALVGGQVRMATLMQTTTSASPETYLGNGTSGMFLWGAQLEAGAYATSYIPTLAASVTRVADAASKTGISSLIGQTEGTIFFSISESFDLSSTFIAQFDDGTNSNRIGIVISSGLAEFFSQVGGSTVAQVNAGAVSSNGAFKCALAYANNDYAFAVNGVIVGTDTSGAVPATSVMRLGNDANGNGVKGAKYEQALLFPTRLTNAQMQELTSL